MQKNLLIICAAIALVCGSPSDAALLSALGTTDITAMAAVTPFFATVWSARFTDKLRSLKVYASVFNRNYEGDIRGGATTVKIPTFTGTVALADYSRDTDLAAPTRVAGTTQDLDIDQEKAFNFAVDDLDALQSQPNLMDAAMQEAAEAVAANMDTYAKGLLQGGRTVANNLVSDSTAYASVTDGYVAEFQSLKEKMVKANIWGTGTPYIIVPPEFITNIEKWVLTSNNTANLYLAATQEETLRNGFAGKMLGFDLMVSNNVTTASGNYRMMAGIVGRGGTLAEQVAKIENYRPEAQFADAVKGLYVYGGKITANAEIYEMQVKAKA